MSEDAKDLNELAKFGCKFIDMQLMLASTSGKQVLSDDWCLGYCFGVFDALAQRRDLDQYTEGLALITIGFGLLCDDHLAGAERVGQAIDRQGDATFLDGNQTGGRDMFAWFTDTQKIPMALFNRVTADARSVPQPASAPLKEGKGLWNEWRGFICYLFALGAFGLLLNYFMA